MKSKKEYRKMVNSLKKSLTYEHKRKLDNIIFDNVIDSKEYKNSNIIFIFVSYDKEVDTHRIMKRAFDDGKVVCVPKVISMKDGMVAIKVNKFEDLTPGAYGILEPEYIPENIVDASMIDVVFLPGVAFGKNFGRLGYGGGFYDRFLKYINNNCPKVGLAYDFQIFDKIPMKEYDKYVDRIITN
ncbi:5-formyltetrahydrofolate cyclo-ligase [Clostridium fermenticellae]|uniref:5-formyltetrahydrofolate cyclo-ligase n=1 Tax=Clostridium fermenticellae TaxID=2068654 RepID=UPI001FAA93F8|nr:5-formyltetrahydrofolate cyclo-ligase [Clostridium fermenticellae]